MPNYFPDGYLTSYVNLEVVGETGFGLEGFTLGDKMT